MTSRRHAAWLVFATFLPLVTAGPSAADEAFDPAQVEQIERIIEDYLIENPEVISRALRRLEEKQRVAQQARVRKALASLRHEIFDDPAAPIAGNLNGNVTVVEFFDYRCGYCKRVLNPMLKAVANDGMVRLVFKEFPTLGAVSYFAARAALASREQNKYQEFHIALMGTKAELSEAIVFELARQVGLDTARLREDMEAPGIKAEIRQNYMLADALEIEGTPAFVIGDEVIRGAIDLNTLRQLITAARQS